MTPSRIVVVGAGAFGAAAALELCRRGFAVELIDRGPLPHPAASSTDTCKAVRMDYGDDVFYTELAERAIAGWRDWNEESGERLYHASGVLFLSATSLDQASFEAESFRTLSARGHRLHALEGTELGRRFPRWYAAGWRHGYFNPEGGWAASERAVAWLLRRAAEAGVSIRENQPVLGLLVRGSRVGGVRLAGGELAAERVLVAAGAWTPFLLPHLAPYLRAIAQPVVRWAPASLAPFDEATFPVWCADIANTGWYGFPAACDGTVKLGHHGAGRPWSPGQPLIPEPADVERFRRFAATALPELAAAPPCEARLCLYCDTDNGDFWFERDAECSGLTVAAGGSGHAFKFAPLLGAILADVVLGRDLPATRRFGRRERRVSTSPGAGEMRGERARSRGSGN